jgi:hypothetical protein
MAINCSSNALLDTLNAKKDALNAKVGELQSLGAGAMADIKAKADEMKDSLLAAVPVPPIIPNFKKELEELKGKVGKELAEAKAAFKERWGDALPDIDIDGLMDKVSAAKSLVDNFEEDLNDFVSGAVSNVAGAAGDALSDIAGGIEDKFDFCKDVPNIDAPKVSAEGKVEQVKVKAEEPTVATDIPKKVEIVEPTVVEKEKAPSVNLKVDDTAEKLKQAKDEMNRALNDYRATYTKLMREASTEALKYKLAGAPEDELITIDSQRVNTIVGRAETKAAVAEITLIEYYNSGKPRKKIARSFIRKFLIAKYEMMKYKEYSGQMMVINRGLTYGGFAGLTLEEEITQRVEYMNEKILEVQDNGDTLSLVALGGHGPPLEGYRDIIVQYQETLNKIRNYKS